MDGVVLLSFEQKVLDQVFMQVDELKVGQVLKVSTTIPKARKD
jgi:rRNA biogenesis protein RRP5